MNSKEFYTHVQAILKDLDKEEKDKFLEEALNAGFQKGELNQHQYLLVLTFTL